ncbi:MAG: efflux RND transporter periplasmic adaptor subunit [Pseudomonadales bacterium]|nr:efflux RND transporter periplasmic adaptor subunit [Pseudomonadales bacterium]
MSISEQKNSINKTSVIFALGLGLVVGLAVGSLLPGNTASTSDSASNEKKILHWVAPMDAAYKRDKPGKSPMGMDLVPVYASQGAENDDASVVRISPGVENNLGLRTAGVEHRALYQQIITVGNVSFSDDKITHIHSRTEGWIEKLYVNSIGSKVKKGAVLFELYSPEFVNAQEEFLSVLSANNSRLINSAKRRLLLLDFTPKQIKRLQRSRKVQRRVEVYAPHDGVVSELNVREGMFIKPSLKIMAVGDLSTIWVVAEVFERQAGWLKVGQKVKMQVRSFNNQSWLGEVQYVYPEFDKKSRTARVRISFDNAELLLKPNMVAELEIQAGNDDLRLLIPTEAVIRTANRQRVVKQLESGKYQSVWVKTGIESAGFVEILDGLEKQDMVVVSAQFLIDSESNIDAELMRMSSDDKPLTVWINAKIINVDIDKHRLNIQHKAIPAWDKIAMTMELAAGSTLMLQHFIEGEVYTIQLEQLADEIVVSAMKMSSQGGHDDH